MGLCISSLFILPTGFLTTLLTTLPVLGKVPVIGVILMITGIAWSLININSLPMVVDMTEANALAHTQACITCSRLWQPFSDPFCMDSSFNSAPAGMIF
jgi:hypothetical protein